MQDQTFYQCGEEKRNARLCSPAEFDAWASAFVDTITGLDREEWDVFERWKFINCLLGERILKMEEQEDGTILLIETEVFSSVSSTKEGEQVAS
jgi:hypothetical protein